MSREAVIAGVDIVGFIGQYVALEPAGKDFKGRCPFHQEKTASLHVSPDRRLFHCFGCKAGGSVLDFAMRIENLEFVDALHWLARKYGIDLGGSEKQKLAAGGRERMMMLNTAAAKFWSQALSAPNAADVRSYASGRGLDPLLASYQIGYAPREWGALTDFLLAKGVKAQELIDLGLIKAREGKTGYYDIFRHRLMFPMRNVTGQVVAFAGRAVAAEDQPKYLNSPATPLYDKSSFLFNLDQAKGALKERGVVIVEGQMDALSLVGAGIPNVVASCGTALTKQHVSTLMRFADYFYIAYDGDAAGRAAAWKASLLVLTHGFSPRIIEFPQGSDPDDWVKAQGGRAGEAWKAILASAKPAVSWWLGYQVANKPAASPQDIRGWILALAGVYQSLPDVLIKREVYRDVANGLAMDEAEIRGLLESPTDARSSARTNAGTGNGAGAGDNRRRVMEMGIQAIEDDVMRRLLSDPEMIYAYDSLQQYMHEPVGDWWVNLTYKRMWEVLNTGQGTAYDLAGDIEFSSICARLLAAPANDAGDNELALRRHRNEYYRREIAREEARWDALSSGSADSARGRYELIGLDEHSKRLKELRGKILPITAFGQ
jgi:DNA primase catalytic core